MGNLGHGMPLLIYCHYSILMATHRGPLGSGSSD